MASDEKVFVFSQQLEKLLAVLSKCYHDKKQFILQRILVNSEYSLMEGIDHDRSFNEELWGHKLRLLAPPDVFYEVMDDINDTENQIRTDINKIARVDQEYISAVSIEIADSPAHIRWRENSGLLTDSSKPSKQLMDDAVRIWGENCWMRAFISHLSTTKIEATKLKIALDGYGISCFVAHEDIEPTKEWQDEIELALRTMDVCIASLTPGFHESKWTDQELGFAMGRAIPVIPLRLGIDPYGFIGKWQGVTPTATTPSVIANDVFQVLLRNERLHPKVVRAFVNRFILARDYAEAIRLVKYLAELDTLPPDLLSALEVAAKNNSQISQAYKVEKKLTQVIQKLKNGSY